MTGLRPEAAGVSSEARVQPRSPKAEVGGKRDGALRARLTVPPAGTTSDRRYVGLLSRKMKVPVSAVRIVPGAASRRKHMRIGGLGVREAESLLRAMASGSRARKASGRG